jgi:palmitoyltransferase
MKMDHHCVWTGRLFNHHIKQTVGNKAVANCVSHITLPHFIRFLSYGVAAMIPLECWLYTRCAVIWKQRHLPSVREINPVPSPRLY